MLAMFAYFGLVVGTQNKEGMQRECGADFKMPFRLLQAAAFMCVE